MCSSDLKGLESRCLFLFRGTAGIAAIAAGAAFFGVRWNKVGVERLEDFGADDFGIDLQALQDLGGDAFALYFDAKTKKVSAVQGGGASPSALTLDLCRSRGHVGTEIVPSTDPLCVMVPGAAALPRSPQNVWIE